MESKEQPMAGPEAKRILIVDDDENIRDLLKMAAQDEGFAVATAVDGSSAVPLISSFHPDLIITDLMMPGQGGYELVRGLQATEHGTVPVIMITARKLDESTKEMVRREGNVVEVLAKPLALNTFKLTLHQVLLAKPSQSEPSTGLNER